MIKGDTVRFDLDTGKKVVAPKNFGMIHDPTGIALDPCVVYVCSCKYDMKSSVRVHRSIDNYVADYFGDEADLINATVEIPDGPWQFMGVVKTIHYERYGHLPDIEGIPGRWYHPFEDSSDFDEEVQLFKSSCCGAFMLQMPEGCIVTAHGYVKP
jgi:hypothetical protein